MYQHLVSLKGATTFYKLGGWNFKYFTSFHPAYTWGNDPIDEPSSHPRMVPWWRCRAPKKPWVYACACKVLVRCHGVGSSGKTAGYEILKGLPRPWITTNSGANFIVCIQTNPSLFCGWMFRNTMKGCETTLKNMLILGPIVDLKTTDQVHPDFFLCMETQSQLSFF